MTQKRAFKRFGIALVAMGALSIFIALSGGGRAFSIGGPVIGFVGAVLLAQAKGRA